MFLEPPVRVSRHRWRPTLCVLAILCAAGASRARAQSCPPGTWTFVADSSGATADAGTTITLTFSTAGAAFAAVGPGRNLTGSGACSAAGNRITLQLPVIGKSVAGAPFTLSGDSLTLPFEVFSSGSGTSTWVRRPDAGRSNDEGSNRRSGANDGSGSGNGTGSGSGNGSGAGSGTSAGGAPASNGSGGAPSPSPAPKPGGGTRPADNPTKANPYAPYVGDWVGNGWSYETRFRQSRNAFVSQLTHGITDPLASREGIDGTVMELTVEHVTHFAFSIDASGHVTGRGGIVYNLLPNLCGLSALVKQANESINLMAQLPAIYRYANELGTAAISSFNREGVETESRLAEDLDSLAEDLSKVKAPVTGTPEYSAAEGTIVTPEAQSEIDRQLVSQFDDMGASEDSRALALKTIMDRCTGRQSLTAPGASFGLTAVAGVPCSIVWSPPVEHEVESVAKTIAQKSEEQLLDKLNDAVKESLEKLNETEKHEEQACSKVGPATLDQFVDQMKERFTDAGVAAIAPAVVDGPAAAALGAAPGLLLSIPGVTQVTYWYRGLVDGPDKSPQAERQFTIDGHLDVSGGAPKLHLTMGELSGGPGQLTIEYMVNNQWDQGHFPAFSPFLEQAGDVQPAAAIPSAKFHAAGTHRNGVAAWQEYEYNWVAHKVTEPLTEQPR